MKSQFISVALICWIALFVSSAISQIASGGDFRVEQSVVASGGISSNGTSFRVEGTIAQSAAGVTSTGGVFGLHGGFWLPMLAPTAAGVSVSGQVRTASGIGISQAVVTLNDPSGNNVVVRTNSFGYYRIDDIVVGQSYILSVSSRRHSFGEPTRVITPFEEVVDLDFVADQF